MQNKGVDIVSVLNNYWDFSDFKQKVPGDIKWSPRVGDNYTISEIRSESDFKSSCMSYLISTIGDKLSVNSEVSCYTSSHDRADIVIAQKWDRLNPVYKFDQDYLKKINCIIELKNIPYYVTEIQMKNYFKEIKADTKKFSNLKKIVPEKALKIVMFYDEQYGRNSGCGFTGHANISSKLNRGNIWKNEVSDLVMFCKSIGVKPIFYPS